MRVFIRTYVRTYPSSRRRRNGGHAYLFTTRKLRKDDTQIRRKKKRSIERTNDRSKYERRSFFFVLFCRTTSYVSFDFFYFFDPAFLQDMGIKRLHGKVKKIKSAWEQNVTIDKIVVDGLNLLWTELDNLRSRKTIFFDYQEIETKILRLANVLSNVSDVVVVLDGICSMENFKKV